MYVHLAYLFTALVVHGIISREFMLCSIVPIPKNKLANVANSEHYRGIALSSILGKILDHIILSKYSDKLCTSDLQFSFKRNSLTDMCSWC